MKKQQLSNEVLECLKADSLSETIIRLNATLHNDISNWKDNLKENGWTDEEIKDALDAREIPHGKIQPDEFINKRFDIQVKMLIKTLEEINKEIKMEVN